MNIAKKLVEGMKLAALFGAVALVVWSMPEQQLAQPERGDPRIVDLDR